MPLICFSETAKRIGVSRNTLERLVARGDFIEGFYLPSGSRRFDTEAIDKWLQSRPRTTPSSNNNTHHAGVQP
jgi:excisionase family DNA binding protein